MKDARRTTRRRGGPPSVLDPLTRMQALLTDEATVRPPDKRSAALPGIAIALAAAASGALLSL